VIVLDGPGEVGGVLDGFAVCDRIAQFRDYSPTFSARRSGTSGRRDRSGRALMSGEAEAMRGEAEAMRGEAEVMKGEAEVMRCEAEEEVMSGEVMRRGDETSGISAGRSAIAGDEMNRGRNDVDVFDGEECVKMPYINIIQEMFLFRLRFLLCPDFFRSPSSLVFTFSGLRNYAYLHVVACFSIRVGLTV
jgi:hypothetical protein